MQSATKGNRQEIVKSRRAILADNGLQSSSDPIALHDSAFVPDTDDVGRGSAGRESSSNYLNIGQTTRRKEGPNVVRIRDARLQPYSPPGFFTDVNLQNRAPCGVQGREIGMAGRRKEPAAIPRLFSQIREELQLVRDASLELPSADEESNTATQPSKSEGDTLRALSRQPQPRSDHDEKASSFDQLQLQHPFSEKSWRNSGFELETVPGLTDKDSSEESLDSGSDAEVGYRVTQSWKPGVKKSPDTTSSLGGKNGDVTEESDLDKSDSGSTIDSFSLEFPRSAPGHPVPTARIFASTIDSLSDDDIAPHALRERTTADNAARALPTQTQAQRSSSIESSPSEPGESTPLTQYAVTQTARESFGPSFTLRTDNTDTVRIAKAFPRERKTSDEKGSSRIAGNSTPLTAFQATLHTASSRQSSTLPSMMLPSTKTAGAQMTSSRIAGSSTPLTAFQVTQTQIHQPQTSTPLSNYAAELTINPTKGPAKGIREERTAGRPMDGRGGAWGPESERLTDAEDLSLEYGRDQQSSLKSQRITIFGKSASQGRTPEASPMSFSSGRKVANESLPLMAEQDLPQQWSSLGRLQDDTTMQGEPPVVSPVRKRARESAKTIHGRKEKARHRARASTEEAVSLFDVSPSDL